MSVSYILLQLCKSLFKAFLELYCRFPGLVRTVKLFIHRHSNSYCECIAWIQCTKPERACKLNLSNQHSPRAAHARATRICSVTHSLSYHQFLICAYLGRNSLIIIPAVYSRTESAALWKIVCLSICSSCLPRPNPGEQNSSSPQWLPLWIICYAGKT